MSHVTYFRFLPRRCPLLTKYSGLIFLQGKPVFLYLPTIYTPIPTDNPQIWLTMDTYVAESESRSRVTYCSLRFSQTAD
jgi:hypothetical protein